LYIVGREILKRRVQGMVNGGEAKKIMTKPLPQILDEIEDSIRLADEAAKNARDAAVEVRKAGDKAIGEATRVANERIEKVEQIAKNALQLAELLKSAFMDGIAIVDKRLSEKAPDTENALEK
jgi:phage shock protein A